MVAGEQMFRLDGRVAVVTGAAGQLGAEMSRALAEAGANVILNGRDGDKLRALEAELTGRDLSARIAPFDVTDASARKEFFGGLERLDILVNNAYNGRTSNWAEGTAEDFTRAYEVTVTAAFACMREAEPALLSAVGAVGHAAVINVASMYGVVSPDWRIYEGVGWDSPPFYGAAKAGLLQLTRYAACALAPRGIRVNAVTPGPFPEPGFCEENPEFHRRLCEKTPMGRVGAAGEICGAVLFLASDASTYVTGISLPVDGGWTAW